MNCPISNKFLPELTVAIWAWMLLLLIIWARNLRTSWSSRLLCQPRRKSIKESSTSNLTPKYLSRRTTNAFQGQLLTAKCTMARRNSKGIKNTWPAWLSICSIKPLASRRALQLLLTSDIAISRKIRKHLSRYINQNSCVNALNKPTIVKFSKSTTLMKGKQILFVLLVQLVITLTPLFRCWTPAWT